MKIAISPCPNDTYLFHAWIAGLVGKEVNVEAEYADIEQLNSWALEKKFPLIKVSISCFPALQKDYNLLPVGCALGWNCGPKLIAKKPIALADLARMRIAIPGEKTTAHKLFQLFCKEPKEKVFCLYHEIEKMIADDVVDAGVIIHETRFVHGFHEVADFGQLWHERHALPLPLGGIALAKEFDVDLFAGILRDSLAYARRHPEASRAFIKHHAQVKDFNVIEQHIDLYVNAETESLSEQGKKAIEVWLK